MSLAQIVSACLLGSCSMMIYKYIRGKEAVSNVPGWVVPVAPLSPLGAIIPSLWWNPGFNWVWVWRQTAYKNHTQALMSIVPFFSGGPALATSSEELCSYLLNNEIKLGLEKPRDVVLPLLAWGENIIASNGNIWNRHRRVVAPAFIPSTYESLCKTCHDVYKEMCVMDEWRGKKEILVSDSNELLTRFSFVVFNRCGFGISIPFLEKKFEKAPDNKMPIEESMDIVFGSLIHRMLLPRWAYKLPIKRLRLIEEAWSTAPEQLVQRIAEREEQLANMESGEDLNYQDLFSRLVAARRVDGQLGLSDEEVIGNTFVLMFAGHETTAHSIDTTLSYLALYPEHQDKVYAEISKLLHDREIFEKGYAEVSQLEYTYACFLEAQRLFPIGSQIIRGFTKDQLLEYTENGKTVRTHVKAGTKIYIDNVGLHHNRFRYDDPEKFEPSRWLNAKEQDITMFGIGPRICPGKRFALVESLCFIAHLLRDWKLDVPLEVGETKREWETKRMQGALVRMSFGVIPHSLKLIRRENSG